jgi:hypothetical protein
MLLKRLSHQQLWPTKGFPEIIGQLFPVIMKNTQEQGRAREEGTTSE